GVPVLVARLFNPVGAGMPERLALPEFAGQIGAGMATLHVGDLDVARDFIHVTEAARLIVALASDPANFGRVVNVCSGVSIPLRQMVEQMIRRAGRPIELLTDPARLRPGEMRDLRGDTSRLRAAGLRVTPLDIADLAAELILPAAKGSAT